MPDLAHDLASLMCSKLCHDLVSPVGALSNGIEVLADETDAELRENALDLIAQSAKTAAAKLQFARLAFGNAGGSAGTLSIASAARAAKEYFETTKASLDWPEGQEPSLPKDAVRLCLNLLLVALDCIPRGGEIRAEIAPDGRKFIAEATGRGAKLPEASWSALTNAVPVHELDARLVQAFFAGHLAQQIGATISSEANESCVRLIASF